MQGTAAESRRGLVQLHVAVLLFGLAGVLGKATSVSALTVVVTRSLIAGLCLGVVLRLSGAPWSVPARQVRGLALAGVVLAAHWLTFFLAIQVSTVAIGLLTYASFPLFVTVLEPIMGRDRLRRGDLGVALAVLAGLVLVVPEYSLGSRLLRGAAWGVTSALLFAVLTLYNRRTTSTVAPVAMAAVQNTVAGLVCLPFVVVCAGGGVRTPRDAVILVVLGTLCTALSHSLFVSGLRYARAHTAAVIAALEPVYGILVAALWLGEVPGARTVAGGLVIVAATVVAARAAPAPTPGPV